MHKLTNAILLAVLTILGVSSSRHVDAAESVSIRYDQADPKVEFAVGDSAPALREAGYRCGPVRRRPVHRVRHVQQGMGPQSFRIRREGEKVIRVVGGDSLGAMYGGLELAEMISLGRRPGRGRGEGPQTVHLSPGTQVQHSLRRAGPQLRRHRNLGAREHRRDVGLGVLGIVSRYPGPQPLQRADPLDQPPLSRASSI